jgi:hypothetical protein
MSNKGVFFGVELAEISEPLVGRQRAHRSSVSNGSRLFAVAGLDGRSQTARRFRDLVEIWTSDLGGPDLLSEGQRQLIRRAASLSIMAEAIEADLARDLAFDVNNYGIVVDRLRRIVETLGLERKAKDVSTSAVVEHFRRPAHRRAL